jgi:hypothetical protein
MAHSASAPFERVERLPVDAVLIDEPAPEVVEPSARSGAPPTDGPLRIASLVRADGGAPRERVVRLAVACMTKRPLALRSWLTYFHAVLGVERFYLRVEHTPDLAPLLAEPPWASLVVATFDDGAGLVRDNGAQQTARQDAHVREAIAAAAAAGLTHLLHCDDDELLYAPAGVPALRRALGALPRGVVSAHALALEATYPRTAADDDAVDPFRETRAFRHAPAAYSSYGGAAGSTGKALGVLGAPGLQPDGPHHFRAAGGGSAAVGDLGATAVLPPRLAVLLHYESASVGRWRSKFADAAAVTRQRDEATAAWIDEQGLDAADAEWLRSTLDRNRARREGDPAPPRADRTAGFYTESARAADEMHDARRDGTPGRLAAAEAAARELWERWKREPADLPTLRPDEPYRVLRDRGLTLINVWTASDRPAARAADGGAAGVAAGRAPASAASMSELEAMLEAARVPPTFAPALAAAAADEGVARLMCGACGRPQLERVVRRAALPLGHRLRLLNLAARTEPCS